MPPTVVALLAVIAAKPLAKLAVVVVLMALLFFGSRSSGMDLTASVLIALFVLVFLFFPRRHK